MSDAMDLLSVLENTDICNFMDKASILSLSACSHDMMEFLEQKREDMVLQLSRQKVFYLFHDIDHNFRLWLYSCTNENNMIYPQRIRNDLEMIAHCPKPMVVPVDWICDNIENFLLYGNTFFPLKNIIMAQDRDRIASVIAPELLYCVRGYDENDDRFKQLFEVLHWLSETHPDLVRSNSYQYMGQSFPNSFPEILSMNQHHMEEDE